MKRRVAQMELLSAINPDWERHLSSRNALIEVLSYFEELNEKLEPKAFWTAMKQHADA